MFTWINERLTIVVEPPKAGTTSIRRAFADAGFHVCDWPHRHWTDDEIIQYIGLDAWLDALTFGILREPLDRLRSQLAILKDCPDSHRRVVRRDFFSIGEAGRKYWPTLEFFGHDCHPIRIEHAKGDFAAHGIDLPLVRRLNKGQPLNQLPDFAMERLAQDAEFYDSCVERMRVVRAWN